MVFLAENLKRVVWVASGTMANGVRTFGTPVRHRWNWQALVVRPNMILEMADSGPAIMDYRQAIVRSDDAVGVKRFDHVWLDYEPDDSTDALASDADFFVVHTLPTIGGTTTVMFKRLSEDD